jgi:hypothetical protein
MNLLLEFMLVVLLGLIWIVLASINYKFGRIARALESIAVSSRQLVGLTIEEQTQPVTRVQDLLSKN